MTTDYHEFIAAKRREAQPAGFTADLSGSPMFAFQRATVEWALHLGRCAIFADTGLGKTIMQLSWAHEVVRHTGLPVLVLAPLAVGAQTVREAHKFGVPDVSLARDGVEVQGPGVYVTNYERLHHFDSARFGGVVLDESSILKAYTGKTKRLICASFAGTPYRLACTATPAPNDHIELGNHSEFLGVMDSHRMLARWFISDQSEAGAYRLKGHAVRPFWDWVTSWARCIGRPSDMGAYSDEGYILPALQVHRHTVDVDLVADRTGDQLFRLAEMSATSIHREKRRTAEARAWAVADVVRSEPGEPWAIWCDTDYEQDELVAVLPGCIDVRGGMSPEVKAERLLRFTDEGGIMVTKPDIAGMGLNWQHCARAAFVGLSYSYERFYQAVRRCWRFGQVRDVDAHVMMAATEQALWTVIDRKAADHEAMKTHMFEASRRAVGRQLDRDPYHPTHLAPLPAWLIGA